MPHAPRQPLLSCDSLVTVTGAGPQRRAVFAKNSDRHWDEAQPLEQVAAATHHPGSAVRLQSHTVPQAERTLAVLGSRPWWAWGFEMGLNEAGVAIGNEAIFTRDPVTDKGLQGTDLVRLGLERGASAAEAKRAITEHVERYGQGGSSFYFDDFRYFNAFLIVDADESYVIETSDRHWVCKRTTGSVAIGNLLTIGEDWDECSEGIEEYARERGWWVAPASRRFDFRAAFQSREFFDLAEPRYRSSCEFIAGEDPGIASMMRHMRNHHEAGLCYLPDSEGEKPRPLSVCMHAPGELNQHTAATLIAELGGGGPPEAWCSMVTPCTSAFIPVRVGEQLPVPLTIASDRHDERSHWWRVHELNNASEADPQRLTPLIQEVFLPWEAEILELWEAGQAPPLAEIFAQLAARLDEAASRLDPVPAG